MTTRVKVPSRAAGSASNTRKVSLRSRLGRLGERLAALARSNRRTASFRKSASWGKERVPAIKREDSAKAQFISSPPTVQDWSLPMWSCEEMKGYTSLVQFGNGEVKA